LSCRNIDKDLDDEKQGNYDWKKLESILTTFVENDENFVLDRTFLSVTDPADSVVSSLTYRQGRNVYDLRFLRVDNFHTPNGRDVFVPHCVSRSSFLPTAASLKMNCQEQLSGQEAVPDLHHMVVDEEDEEDADSNQRKRGRDKGKDREWDKEAKRARAKCSSDERAHFIFAYCGGASPACCITVCIDS